MWFSRRYVEGGRYSCYNQTDYEKRRATAAERRVGFDWLLFQMMLGDGPRLDAYRRDIAATVPGKRVLEIGPGPTSVLSRLCLDFGAESVVSVEGGPWIASQAERRMMRERRHSGRWQVIPKLPSDLTIDDVGGGSRFDVLVLEIYDTIAGQEHVVETVEDLRRRGFSFDSVISRGFETWVGPAAPPPTGPLTRIERMLLGWGAGSEASVEGKLRQQRSVIHGDLAMIERIRLSLPQAWQTADFETDCPARTEPALAFDLADPRRYGDFLLHNRFFFHDSGVLDTLGRLLRPAPPPARRYKRRKKRNSANGGDRPRSTLFNSPCKPRPPMQYPRHSLFDGGFWLASLAHFSISAGQLVSKNKKLTG